MSDATPTAADIATRLGLRKYPRSWRGDCPACSYHGTFALRAGRDGRALTWCASCQDRDAIRDALARAAGSTWQPPQRPDAADEAGRRARATERALALWSGSEPAIGTLADTYLTARHLPGLAASAALRFRGDCHHPEGGGYPALVAAVSDVTGAPIAVHRTYLARDGAGKAGATPAKASLGPIWGGAIRLHPPGPELAIGEGIETAAAAGRLLGLPAWAAISAGNLAAGLVLPAEVRSVMIAVDRDPAGEAAAARAAVRWRVEGRRVRCLVPDRVGADAADVLRGVAHA